MQQSIPSDRRSARHDIQSGESFGIHAEVRWHASEEDYGRPTLACVNCGAAWHDTRSGMTVVQDGDGWCRTRGHSEQLQSDED